MEDEKGRAIAKEIAQVLRIAKLEATAREMKERIGGLES
jgi:hypothetical protein